ELLYLLVADREGAVDLGQRRAFELVLQQLELLGHLRERKNAAVFDQQLNEIACLLRQRRLDQASEEIEALGSVQPRIGQCGAHVVDACQFGELGQQGRPGRETRLVVASRSKNGFGVGPGDSGKFSHGLPCAYSCAFSWSSSAA